MIMQRAMREGNAAPEPTNERREKSQDQNQEKDKGKIFPCLGMKEGLESGKGEQGQDVVYKGEKDPGQNNRQVCPDIG